MVLSKDSTQSLDLASRGAFLYLSASEGRSMLNRISGITLCTSIHNELVGVSNKHRLVNLYLCALGPDGALKDTRFILVRLNVPTSSLCCSCY